MQRLFILLTVIFLNILGFSQSNIIRSKQEILSKIDFSKIRGFNYTPAYVDKTIGDGWLDYNEMVVENNLNMAKSLNLNQARVFVRYSGHLKLKDSLTIRIRHFIRECHKRDIGVILVLDKKSPWDKDSTLKPLAKKWVQYLTNSFSGQPGFIMWDVMNEPDFPTAPKEVVKNNMGNAKFMANLFRELDPNTPITIGCAYNNAMEELADYADVLQFHDYMSTREEIRNNISRAKQFAAKVGKPLINGELGCVGRANPYDITLEEHTKAGVGWYIWELMIVRAGWGVVHGVFYEDGTVRDPSIPAAILGFYRKREANILPAVPDYEGWVTKMIDRGHKWLGESKPSWDDGLNIAETCANLLESAELVAMRIPPIWEVNQLRKAKQDIPALRSLILQYCAILEPYKLKNGKK